MGKKGNVLTITDVFLNQKGVNEQTLKYYTKVITISPLQEVPPAPLAAPPDLSLKVLCTTCFSLVAPVECRLGRGGTGGGPASGGIFPGKSL